MVHALIFAGGVGLRMKSKENLPKQFMKIGNKEVIIHTIEKFEKCEDVDNIVVVCKSGWEDFLLDRLKFFKIKKVSKIISGGSTGFESRLFGLEHLHSISKSDDDIVLIHDGVRPLISPRFVSENIETAKKFGNSITVAPSIETTIYAETKSSYKIINRERCMLARAPQTFFLKDIYSCYQKAADEGNVDLVDSASLANFYGHTLHFIDGPAENIKITTMIDLYCAEGILKQEEI